MPGLGATHKRQKEFRRDVTLANVWRAKELLCGGRPNDVLGLWHKFWARKRKRIPRRE